MGIPGVYSRVLPYEQVIVDGENGLLAASLHEWSEKIQLLILNQDLRYNLAMNAQETIKAKYLMSKSADLWSKTYNQITKRGITKTNQNFALQHLIKNIADQMIEYYKHCDSKFQILSDDLECTTRELESKKQDIKNLQNEVGLQTQNIDSLIHEIETHKQEILYYALSKSWNITRPLRKITRYIKARKND